MENRLPLTALLVALTLSASVGVVSAQYSGNPALRNPGATTPIPKRADPPPQTWEPAPQPPPVVRENNPNPSCITLPCNAPPIIRRSPS
ncbi:hypothetical protein EV667_3140 [Ancylobacter aquaticus]|uniref:Uncharacterized protein n=1 Tax=Ancylobacter aquaticus TaxID=100 RepID=A0A4R1I6K2_ANCAQ|nr:hypothetical protein [Ancylobacter aquaticus]TCK29120.1 hypothetical protein EV667_3140 [Ancylobacter aquaticus]